MTGSLEEFVARIVARVWGDEFRSATDRIRRAVADQDVPLPPRGIRWSREASIDRAIITRDQPELDWLLTAALAADPVDWLGLLRSYTTVRPAPPR